MDDPIDGDVSTWFLNFDRSQRNVPVSIDDIRLFADVACHQN